MEAINERGCCGAMEPIIAGEKQVSAVNEPAAETKAPMAEAKAPAAETPVEIKSGESVKFAVKPEGSVTALLFKTPSCPNCKAAGAILDKAGIEYEPLNANEERELVKKFGIKQAPTLVLVNGDSFEKYRGVSDIKGWLMHK